MGKRHKAIGLKQAIRLEWMEKTSNFLLAGFDVRASRKALHEFLSNRMGDGSTAERGATSRTQVVNILMNIWVSPSPEISSFRDACLVYLRQEPQMVKVLHWSMISAAYPFWFSVARQVGRLLSLQDKVTQAQISGRLKEQYGDRQTVSRYARAVIRSFVSWGVLKDSASKGCYEKATPIPVTDPALIALIYESVLHTMPEGKVPLALLPSHPALFAFKLPVTTGDQIARHNDHIEVVRYGLDEDLLKLRG